MPNKKVLTFLGPIHHINILGPVMDALARAGATESFFTCNAEAAFEHGLAQRLTVPWHFAPFFVNPPERQQLYERYVEVVRPYYLETTPLNLIIPAITDRILWDIATDVSGIRNLLQQERPTMTLALHEINRWGKLLAFWSSEMGLPVFSVQEGMYYGHPLIYTGHNEYSTSLVWGEATKATLIAAGNAPERIEVIGHPNLRTRWQQATTDPSIAWASLPPHFQGKQIVVVYVTGVTLNEQFDLAPMMEGLEQTNYRLVFQTAIMGNIPLNKKIHELLLPYQEVAFYSNRTDLLWHQAGIAEVICVWGCSTFGLEMAWAGKPLAEMWAPGQSLSFEEEGVAVPAMMTPDAKSGKIRSAPLWIERALELFGREDHRQKVQEWVHGHICDDDAADRFAARILQ